MSGLNQHQRRILEGSTPTYRAVLTDGESPAGTVGSSVLISLTLTYYDVATQSLEATRGVINSREDLDVLNANQVTVDTDGNLEWSMDVEDTIVVDGRLDDAGNASPLERGEYEEHIALFKYTWNSGGDIKTGVHEVRIDVKNLLNEPWVAPVP